MAFALGPAAATAPAAVDVESLLWELRDLVRGLGQVRFHVSCVSTSSH